MSIKKQFDTVGLVDKGARGGKRAERDKVVVQRAAKGLDMVGDWIETSIGEQDSWSYAKRVGIVSHLPAFPLDRDDHRLIHKPPVPQSPLAFCETGSSLCQQILDVSKAQREPMVEHTA